MSVTRPASPIEIDIWSDVVCPWCFIGRRRLQKAIAAHAGSREVIVRHRAFQLQPDARDVVRTDEMLATKYKIDKAQVAAMQANVCSIADGEGLCYDLSDTFSGNTADAHRLIIWAEKIGKGDELLEAIYSAYFEKKLPIFTHADLVAIASTIGIDSKDAQELLNSNEYTSQVSEDQNLAHQLGATGVPFYVIDMKYAISGAQPQQVFDQLFKGELTGDHSGSSE
jgi:predicted DsbA family dithiol-disulfide isomerase